MKKTILRTAVITALFGATQAQAGGLWLNQFGDFASGRSSAGAAAGVDEAAAIIHNPAAGTRIEGSQLFGAVGAIIPDVEFDIDYSDRISGDGDGGSAGLNAPAGSVAYTNDLGTEDWSFGIYFAGLAGAGLEYDSGWVGRFQNTEVELLMAAIAPTVGFQVTDNFSIGASLQYYYATLDFELELPSLPNRPAGTATLDGTDDDLGFTLGAIYEFSDSTRLGIKYQSELDADFDGKLKIKNNIADARATSNTEMTLAQIVRVGLHHDLDDQISLGFTIGWDDWSAMEDVFVSLPEVEAGLARNWDDTYHYAAGVAYSATPEWDFTMGIAYDTNPVSSHDRTADMPIDRQVRYTGGARYKLRDNLTVGGYLNYTDLGSARISTERWGGEYGTNQVFEFSVYLNWVI
jgi:long-chain fatty acid transport protein